MKTIKNLIIKYKELIIYGIFGVGTTLVNFLTYELFNMLLGVDLYWVSNIIAWFVSVVFAYVTNKLFVFESKSWSSKTAGKEFIEFVGARLFSFGVEEGGMWLFVDILAFGEKSLTLFGFTITGQIIAKLALAVIVVILNYFFSKFIIFKKKKEQGDR